MDINKMKEHHQEIQNNFENIISEKMYNTIGISSDSRDINELKVLYKIYNNFNTIFNIYDNKVSSEILNPWMMLQMHNALMTEYHENNTDTEYGEAVDKVSRYIFADLFGDD